MIRQERVPILVCHGVLLTQEPGNDVFSDYGTVTLLFQDSVGGLEVQNPHTKVFQPARPIVSPNFSGGTWTKAICSLSAWHNRS